MNVLLPQPLIAVDVGNTRIKAGRFESHSGSSFPEPVETLEVASDAWSPERLPDWLNGRAAWRIASVFGAASERIAGWVEMTQPAASLQRITADSLPLRIALPEKAKVGMDRLLGAVAANKLRHPERAAVVVDLGTAITVDLVSASGEFLGGAILPGIGLSARALHEKTDLLPSIAMSELHDPPPALGASTVAAIHSGLYWGAVGAVRELVNRLAADLAEPPQVFLTGGAAPAVARLLGADVKYEPHLVLAGIAIAHHGELGRELKG